ncbi:MAG: hypothetical protein LUF85_04520 [Bacteroides sp.]|nr:hypothetical protein [Bacteroides sp.]
MMQTGTTFAEQKKCPRSCRSSSGQKKEKRADLLLLYHSHSYIMHDRSAALKLSLCVKE